MSGHSKWAQIKRQKGASDKKKGALFSKIIKVITFAARAGGGDPEKNFKLRLAIDKAKTANMPSDNIERAIKRGTGEGSEGTIEEVIYEGYGPGGIAIIIQSMTDNKNRTTSEIRSLLTQFGGNLGESNSVRWNFDEKGVIKILAEGKNPEEVELKAIEAGADDIENIEEEITIYTKKEDLQRIKTELEKSFKIDYAELEMVPKNKIAISDPKIREKIEALNEALENHEEINNLFTNLK